MPLPILAGAGIAAGASALGGLLGKLFSSGDKQRGIDLLLKSGQTQYGGYGDLKTDRVDPSQEGNTEFDKINLDPRTRDVQMEALTRMMDLSNKGGMSIQDRAKLNDIEAEANANEASQRGAVLGRVNAMGQGGMGADISSSLIGTQGAANRMSRGAYQVSSDAADRALRALSEGSTIAGNVRSTDYSMARDRSAAQDRINAFNTENVNQSKYYNSQAGVNDWLNNLSLRDRRYMADKDAANAYLGRGAETQQFWGNLGRGVGDTVSGAFGTPGGPVDPNNPNKKPGLNVNMGWS